MTDDTVPLFEFTESPAAHPLRQSVQRMIKVLEAENRLTPEHEPLCMLALKLSNALEASGGRGASVALLSAQFREVWATLAALPKPVDPDADMDMEVSLLPVAHAS